MTNINLKSIIIIIFASKSCETAKNVKKQVSTSIWSVQQPNTGINIQQKHYLIWAHVLMLLIISLIIGAGYCKTVFKGHRVKLRS